jgi:hypothetical protein
MGREVSRGCTCQRKSYTRGIFQNSYAKFFLCFLLSLLRLNFRRGVVKGNCLGKFSPGLNFLEDISVERVFLLGSGARFPGIN